jgi:hypothetical protein
MAEVEGRCGRRKQRNPRRKNGKLDSFSCVLTLLASITIHLLGEFCQKSSDVEPAWRLAFPNGALPSATCHLNHLGCFRGFFGRC